MFNPDESIAELKKHFKKLQYVIDNDAVFTLFDSKVLRKNMIDDVLCCIEASFPAEYKEYIKQQGANKIKSRFYYDILKEKIQNKFMFSSSHYSVKFKETPQLISSIIKNLGSDFRIICENL